ncbi:MAG: fimbrillin family protein [Muribaculaceae bacterium]|nr:fimbrillin family protein [Muribaculaceae bacterium]
MKARSFKYAAITILTLLSASSCSVDEDFSALEESQQKMSPQAKIAEETREIIFRVTSDNNARSADGNILRQFKITAFEDETNYYDGRTDLVTTSDNGISWTSDYCRYWPGNRPSNWNGLTFYAYTDGSSRNRSVIDETGAGNLDMTNNIPMIKDFKVKNDISEQRDLMYAVAKDVNNAYGNGEVNLNFKHALCKVYFSASNNNPNISNIEILSIELGGVKGEGSYRFPDLSSQNANTFNISNSEQKGNWQIAEEAEDQSYTVSDININLGSYGQSNSSVLTEGLLLIPQQVEARKTKTSTIGGFIKVTVKITPKGVSDANAPEVLFFPTSVNWKEGKSYCYDINWSQPFTAITTCESTFNN